jgi:ABC-type nitrate/sulfonate/bicarbonate transport system substrate-binding protein
VAVDRIVNAARRVKMTKLLSRRSFLASTAIGATGFSIAGSPFAAGFAWAAEKTVMQLGWIANVEYMGMFIADDAGYYKDEGLDMEIVPGGPAVSVSPIVVSGKALVGLDSVDTIARARTEGAKLKLIGAELQRNPTAVMSLADKPIKTPQDLVGKKFGVQQNGVEIVNLFFRMNDIDPASVTIVPVQFDPAPLVAGEVDAFMSFLTNQPVQLALKGIETNNFLLSDYGYTAWADCLVVHEDSLADAEKRKRLVGVVRGTVRGWQDAIVDPKRGATLAVEKYGKSFGLDQKAQELTAERLIPLVATDETKKNGLFTMSKEGIDANIEIIKAAGLSTTAEELFDTSVLEEAFGGKTTL